MICNCAKYTVRAEEEMSFTHSIMFHHFHNDKHLPAQGSLSSAAELSELDALIEQQAQFGRRVTQKNK